MITRNNFKDVAMSYKNCKRKDLRGMSYMMLGVCMEDAIMFYEFDKLFYGFMGFRKKVTTESLDKAYDEYERLCKLHE